MMNDAENENALVAVFHATDPELLPLAEGVLEQEGIGYLIRPSGSPWPVGFGHQAEFGGAEGAADVLVNARDAARAREVLGDLQREPDAAGSPPVPPPVAAAPAAPAGRPYRLREAGSGVVIGEITERQLASLRDELEEESSTDRDYYIDEATIEVLEQAGADAELVAMLRRAVGSRDGVEIEWSPIT